MARTTEENLKSAIASATRAVEYARRVANTDESKLEMLVDHLHSLSELRVEEGEFMRAESLLREAMFRIDDANANHRQKPRPILAANAASSLGFLYDRWGKASKAREWYEKSISLAQAGGFLDTDLGASVSNNLGMVEKKVGNADASEHHYRTALRIFILLRGAESTEVSAVYNNLGVLLYTRNRYPEAEEMHQKAMEIRQKLHDPISGAGAQDLRQSWQNLAAVYKAKGELEKAASLLRQAGLKEEPSEAVTPNWIVRDFRSPDAGLLSTRTGKTERIPLDSPPKQGFKVETFGG